MQSINEIIRQSYKHGKTPSEIYQVVRPMSESKPKNLRDKITKVIRKEKQKLRDKDIHADRAEMQNQFVKGRSTLVNKQTNEPVMEWIKTDTRKEDLFKATERALSAILDKFTKFPIQIPSANIKSLKSADFLAFYPIPDAHMGMLANMEETGYDSNLKIMEERFYESFQYLIDNSPEAETALVVDLGDFIHAANDLNRTKSGHPLDTDSRHWKVVEVSFNMIFHIIMMLLKKHQKVVFKSVSGNHSPDASYYLLLFLDACFKGNDRVEIEVSPRSFKYYQFGKNLLAFNHGERLKEKDIVEVVMYDNKSVLSDVEFTYIHLGHLHHNKSMDTRLARIEVHNSLNTMDAWAYNEGYRNMIPFEAKCIVYDKNKGRIGDISYNNYMEKV